MSGRRQIYETRADLDAAFIRREISTERHTQLAAYFDAQGPSEPAPATATSRQPRKAQFSYGIFDHPSSRAKLLAVAVGRGEITSDQAAAAIAAGVEACDLLLQNTTCDAGDLAVSAMQKRSSSGDASERNATSAFKSEVIKLATERAEPIDKDVRLGLEAAAAVESRKTKR